MRTDTELEDVRVAERYALEGPLGRGAYGVVWAAVDTHTGQRVAIKHLLREHLTSERARRRLAREAEILRALRHPNIAAAYDVVPHEEGLALVLELIEGHTLRDELLRRAHQGDRPSARSVAALAAAMAQGLGYAHAHGVVHRDLKPANVMITPDARVIILDFGLASFLEPADDEARTTLGRVMGTPMYMPPEQAAGERADDRSDGFALACMLFEAATLEYAWLRDAHGQRLPMTVEVSGELRTYNAPGLIAARIATEPRRLDLDQLRPDLPAPLRQWIAGASAVDPAARPTIVDLVRLLGDAPRLSWPPPMPPADDTAMVVRPRVAEVDPTVVPARGASGRGPHGASALVPPPSSAALAPNIAAARGASAPAQPSAAGEPGASSTDEGPTAPPPPAPRRAGSSDLLYAVFALALAVLGGGVAWQLLRAEAAPVELPQATTGPGHGAPAHAAGTDHPPSPRTSDPLAASSSTPTPAEAVAQGTAEAPSSTTTPGLVLASTEVVLAASHGSTAAVILGAAARGPADAELLPVAGGNAWVGCLEPTDAACGADERPLRAVEVAPFALERHEVTAAAYGACVARGACTPAGTHEAHCTAGRADRLEHPINCVDAAQAATYCASLGRRLPTAHEWEVAARQGGRALYPWGSDAPSCARANLAGCGGTTRAVTRGATATELAGNVWEWTADGTPERREIRGGSFYDPAHALRTSNRGWADARARLDRVGFRCVR
jgi:formylglycine-generating enzyme required for sulfatase activity/tRNA A-37 threonylcarbamoyl transferase component Bud32